MNIQPQHPILRDFFSGVPFFAGVFAAGFFGFFSGGSASQVESVITPGSLVARRAPEAFAARGAPGASAGRNAFGATSTFVPQRVQNRAPGRISAPQWEQCAMVLSSYPMLYRVSPNSSTKVSGVNPNLESAASTSAYRICRANRLIRQLMKKSRQRWRRPDSSDIQRRQQ